MTTVVAVGITLALLLDGLNPIDGSRLGLVFLRGAAVCFLVACSRCLQEHWSLRLLVIAVATSVVFTCWWHMLAHSGEYRITVSTSVIFFAELIVNALVAATCLFVEMAAARRGHGARKAGQA